MLFYLQHNHSILGQIFGDGNGSKGILRFRVEHDCSNNSICRHFEFTFPEAAEIETMRKVSLASLTIPSNVH
jgi:hypothetical protein